MAYGGRMYGVRAYGARELGIVAVSIYPTVLETVSEITVVELVASTQTVLLTQNRELTVL